MRMLVALICWVLPSRSIVLSILTLSAQPTSVTTSCCSRADSRLTTSLAPPFRLLYGSTKKLWVCPTPAWLSSSTSKHLVVCIKLLFTSVIYHFVISDFLELLLTAENYDQTSSDLESLPSLDSSPGRVPADHQSDDDHPASPITQYVFHNIKCSLCVNCCIVSVN